MKKDEWDFFITLSFARRYFRSTKLKENHHFLLFCAHLIVPLSTNKRYAYGKAFPMVR